MQQESTASAIDMKQTSSDFRNRRSAYGASSRVRVALPSRTQYLPKPNRARGYSLLEIALAMLVLGILLGGVLTPVTARYELEESRKAQAIMEAAREAVYGYAIVQATARRNAIDPDDSNRYYAIPEGRPYLPCPDITGDGLENRNEITADPVDVSNNDQMVLQGTCMQQKGMLPWRTLGLQNKGDLWGSYLTYWVDPAFSSQLIGFDETFRADTVDPRRPPNVENRGLQNETVRYQPRASRTVPPDPNLPSRDQAARDITGAIICDSFFPADGTLTGGCPSSPNSLPERQLNVLAGIVNTSGSDMVLGPRTIPNFERAGVAASSTGVVDGVAFVIVSHGPNQLGAIRQPQVARAPNLCMQREIPEYGNDVERVNAYYRDGHPFLDMPFNCRQIPNPNDRFAENIYISTPRSNVPSTAGKVDVDGDGFIYNSEFGGFDDIVMWASPNLLFGELLRGGVLPIPKLQFLPESRQ